jgi:hypothetical protein
VVAVTVNEADFEENTHHLARRALFSKLFDEVLKTLTIALRKQGSWLEINRSLADVVVMTQR